MFLFLWLLPSLKQTTAIVVVVADVACPGGHKKMHVFTKVILHSMDSNKRGDKLKPPLLDSFGISALRSSRWSNIGNSLTIAMADK